MPLKTTKRQFRFLLSKGSPLNKRQKQRLISERRSGRVKFRRKKRRGRK